MPSCCVCFQYIVLHLRSSVFCMFCLFHVTVGFTWWWNCAFRPITLRRIILQGNSTHIIQMPYDKLWSPEAVARPWGEWIEASQVVVEPILWQFLVALFWPKMHQNAGLCTYNLKNFPGSHLRTPTIVLGPRSGHSTFQNIEPPLSTTVVGPRLHLLHIADRFGRILYCVECVHSTQYSLLVATCTCVKI